VAIVVLAALSMGGTCRQETTQGLVNTFLTQIATATGQAAADAVLDRATQ
jgi:hypothetical protein